MKKNRIIALLIVCIMLLSSITVQAASSNIVIDHSNSEEGIVRVVYEGINIKTKVMIEKDSTTYYYDLKKEEDSFPLQLGEGNYKVSVLTNTSGTSYKVVAKESFYTKITEKNSVYLQSTQSVLWNEDMEAIKIAKTLAKGEKDDKVVVKAIYDYIIKNLSYDYNKVKSLSSDYIPDIDTILNADKGICYDYSVLFGAMLRSRGIPTKLVKGYRDDISAYHAWNEVYLDGSWKVIDTTYDDSLTNKANTNTQIFQDASKYEKLKEY